ncbi:MULTISPECIES: hypothetical protein [unclassified Vibrio]|uniref:hypothetical protein n=1 Tax=unclassified Vibrio TaxID=2614977 RepID=UPI0013613F79|nr:MULTISPECIES: hypothetical protein [unclassified Vibrio]NAW57763.1 hypothetical protein [Vibrio sp. V36_P2S2PM302]NAX28420.1 hypothetical protein [Vibrio sp. V38_P2S17PM301]NAX29576.1 hypothetical protein [Vibrio sp. V37_P2S8PM304]
MSTPKSNLSPCPWEQVADPLRSALGDYHGAARRKVSQGQEHTFICEGAALLLRGEGSELVVVGFAGEHKLKQACPHILTLAKTIGAQTIRLHTKRRGECRYLNRLGYPFEQQFINDEYVLRMVVNGRQFEQC